MTQPRAHSLMESIANVMVGYGIAVLGQLIVYPFFGIQVALADNAKIALVFTFISIARSYCLRRAFNHWHGKAACDE